MFYPYRFLGNRIVLGHIYFLVLAMLMILTGCANRYFEPPCDKLCVTDELIFSEAWYSCYKRGVSCMQGRCLEYARDEFLRAIQKREKEAIWVSTYGMHRLPEYFPNRELGIVYYHLGDFDKALKYLQISLEYFESAKAKYYLNKVRREKLILTKKDRESPQLFLDSLPLKVSNPLFMISGLARDDNFVANVMIQINNQKPLFLLELSQPLFYAFHQKILLQPGINEVTVKVTDLLEKKKVQRIKILLDQEGPVIYFAEPEGGDSNSPGSIQGLVYDPSDIKEFYLNRNRIELNKVEIQRNLDLDQEAFYQVYWFRYPISPEEWQRGILYYKAEDRLQNINSGAMTILEEERPTHVQSITGLSHKTVRIAMVSQVCSTDLSIIPPLPQIAKRRNLDPVRIRISQIPQETFAEEIAPQIEILASRQIAEVYINEQPILSIYGVNFAKLFTSVIKRYLGQKEEGKFLFPRTFKLNEGKNIINIKVIDQFGETWEKSIQINKKLKQIYKLDERWRIAIPIICNLQGQNHQKIKNKLLTYQLIKAFIKQSRFKIIDFENIPVFIHEKNLHYYIGTPLLGLSEECKIWIDAFLLGFFQETEDSFTLLASLIDLETGEILATKDIFEEIEPIYPLETEWNEGLMEHVYQNCSALATKFKNHFPLCEGRVIHFTEDTLDTSISKDDGLIRGMKLIVYDDQKPEGYPMIIGEAKVRAVLEKYSLAEPLGKWRFSYLNNISINWGVITR